MKEHLHRLSAAANSAALVMIVLVSTVLLTSFAPSELQTKSPAAEFLELVDPEAPAPSRVVLVVIDGLRVDIARDAACMPFLAELARRGGSGIAQVESLVPSTIAGVTTLATSEIPHPVSFVRDFRSPPADHGGIFQMLARQGERSFVSGPVLWSDLYGQWAQCANAAPPVGGGDQRVLEAGLAALQDPSVRFGVIHFGAPDEAAHLNGAKSKAYREAATWCDDAIRRIAEVLAPDGALIVTSDHGVTDSGGHAGPEPAVLQTPIVTFGPGFRTGAFPLIRQRDIPHCIARVLNLHLPDPPRTERWPSRTFALLLCITLSIVCIARIGGSLACGDDGRPQAFWLNLTLWCALALLGFQQVVAAGMLALIVLAVVAHSLPSGAMLSQALPPLAVGGAWLLFRLATESRVEQESIYRISASLILMLLIASFAYFSRKNAIQPLGRLRSRLPPFPMVLTGLLWTATGHILGGSAMGLAVGLGFFAGAGMGRWMVRLIEAENTIIPTHKGLVVGITVALAAEWASMTSGQSLSLASLDVRVAYHAALRGFGLIGATALVAVVYALPFLATVNGCFASIHRQWSPTVAGRFLVGLAGVPVGAATASTFILLLSDDLRLQSLSLGGLLRAGAALIFLTGAAALVMLAPRWKRRRPMPVSHDPIARSSR